MFTHNLDPIIFQFGFLSIRWYSLAYILGILLGWYYGKKILVNRQKIEKNEFEIKEFDNLITYLILSIIIGGRIGYIFFYNFEYYLQNPSDIVKIWEGGMSFHGALIGIIVGTVLFSKKKNIETFCILDVLACVSPIGLFFGRIANFINGELVGKVTSVSWSVIFPKIDMLPRHPSQLYQAVFEGIFLFFIMNYIISRKNYKTGTCSSLFLIFYGCFRIFTEMFREPDKQIGYLFGILSMGTILSIAMLIIGLIMFLVLKKKMRSKSKFFKNDSSIPVDKFFQTVLYDKKIGYYNSKLPFGKSGDYITAPLISNLFSEMIGIWMVSTWEKMGKPKFFNIIELGPGDGSLTRNLLQVFKNFSKFNSIKKIYLYETSSNLKNLQKKNINNKNIQWINDFKKIKKGPVIFFGNEFFDAIPIKQFKRKNNNILEKYYFLGKDNKIQEIYKNAKKNDVKILKMFESLKNLKFIEFPKFGLNELKKIIKKISKLNGCILMIDYGYLKPSNKSTLQSVFMHNKNRILDNLGKADVTSHVNFLLLKEFFQKNKLNVKKVISQKRFLESLGIMERAKTISEKMKFNEQTNLYLRLRRILSPRSMGELFKVILAYKFKNVDYHEFK